MSDFVGLWTAAARLLCPRDSPGKNTGVDSTSFSRGTPPPPQGSNPRLRLGRWTLCPFLTSASTLPSRFSGVAGVPELQELKRTAELRSRLQNVSVVGSWAARSRAESRGLAGLPS